MGPGRVRYFARLVYVDTVHPQIDWADEHEADVPGSVLSTVYSRDVRFPPKEAHVGVSTKESEIMNGDDKKHRSHLPMPNTTRRGLITYDAKDPDTRFPPIEQLRPPKGAPNVLLILLDDAGFGSASAFGGPCQTPNAEKLAAE